MPTTEQTTEFIQQLTADLRPVSLHAVGRRLLIGLTVGVVSALLLLLLSVGTRADLGDAIVSQPFWMKWLYSGSVCAIGFSWCLRLARPEVASGTLPWWLLLPVALLVLCAVHELDDAPAAAAHQLWLGHSALRCPFNIAGCAVPVFIGMVWVLRHLAPTRLRPAGCAAGCVAGASGAMVYALCCNESAAPFVLLWYSVGMLLPALLGAALGPRLLRW